MWCAGRYTVVMKNPARLCECIYRDVSGKAVLGVSGDRLPSGLFRVEYDIGPVDAPFLGRNFRRRKATLWQRLFLAWLWLRSERVKETE